MAGLDVEHERVGVLREPLVPGRVDDREDVELDAAPDEIAPDGLAGELLPEGVGGAVVHELVRAVEETAGAEAVDLVADATVVEDGAPAEGAVGERNGDAADGVVDHLVPVDDAAGVGAGVAVDLDADDAVFRADPGGGLLGRDESRVLEGRDAVHRHATPEDLLGGEGAGFVRVEEGAHLLLDALDQAVLELDVEGRLVVGCAEAELLGDREDGVGMIGAKVAEEAVDEAAVGDGHGGEVDEVGEPPFLGVARHRAQDVARRVGGIGEEDEAVPEVDLGPVDEAEDVLVGDVLRGERGLESGRAGGLRGGRGALRWRRGGGGVRRGGRAVRGGRGGGRRGGGIAAAGREHDQGGSQRGERTEGHGDQCTGQGGAACLRRPNAAGKRADWPGAGPASSLTASTETTCH